METRLPLKPGMKSIYLRQRALPYWERAIELYAIEDTEDASISRTVEQAIREFVERREQATAKGAK